MLLRHNTSKGGKFLPIFKKYVNIYVYFDKIKLVKFSRKDSYPSGSRNRKDCMLIKTGQITRLAAQIPLFKVIFFIKINQNNYVLGIFNVY